MGNKGFSTIVIVIVISAISLLMAVTASFLALGDLEMSSDYLGEKKSLYIAESCMEDTIQKIKENTDYTATNYSLSLNDGLCIINTEENLDSKKINIKAKVGIYYKNIEAEIKTGDKIELISYNLK